MADRTVQIGTERVPFTDDGAKTYYVDLLTEISHASGVVRIGLGHAISNIDLKSRAVGEVYLRMNATTAIQMATALLALAEKSDEMMAGVIEQRKQNPSPKKARRSN